MADTGYPGFPGKVGRTREESEPHWDLPLKARKGAPNVVVILMDEMGGCDLGSYGSEIVTQLADALARRGIRFNIYVPSYLLARTRGLADGAERTFGFDRLACDQ